tara:strand:- start:120 stop:425 length:306 start_codon:yes stop_codon:yes gene_type:complete
MPKKHKNNKKYHEYVIILTVVIAMVLIIAGLRLFQPEGNVGRAAALARYPDSYRGSVVGDSWCDFNEPLDSVDCLPQKAICDLDGVCEFENFEDLSCSDCW